MHGNSFQLIIATSAGCLFRGFDPMNFPHPTKDMSVQDCTFVVGTRMQQEHICCLWSNAMDLDKVPHGAGAEVELHRSLQCRKDATILSDLPESKVIIQRNSLEVLKGTLVWFRSPQHICYEARGLVGILPCDCNGEDHECLQFAISAIEVGDVLGINGGFHWLYEDCLFGSLVC